MVLAAGGKAEVADIPTGLWLPYTPVWTASGTAPAIGNGSIVGRYCQMGDVVLYIGRMTAGATTTFGTGSYSWSLPVTSAQGLSGNSVIGSCWIRDSSGNDYQGQLVDGTTTFIVRPGASSFGGNSQVGATAPMTWANGDFISWQCTYEAA
jgi:hypothetical protein